MRHQTIIYPFALALLLLAGCHSAVYEDLSDCPQQIRFTFHVRTPNEISYPDSQIDRLRLFAFDEEERLIAEWTDDAVAFLPGYALTTDFYRPGGTTTFVAWAAKDLDRYDLSAFVPGAKKSDLVLFMAKQQEKIAATAGPLFVGTPEGGALKQEADRSALGSVTDEVHFPLTQISNHLDITIEGLPKGHTYAMTYRAHNSRYAADGTLLEDTPFEWTTDDFTQTAAEGKETATLHATYDILRLVEGQRGDYLITITDETGRVVYEFDPLHDFILYDGLSVDGEANPFRDHLDLNHHYTIRIRLDETSHTGDDEATYMAVMVTIQDWNIVFRNESLG